MTARVRRLSGDSVASQVEVERQETCRKSGKPVSDAG